MYTLRQASRADFPAIRSLIYQSHINPLGLDWRRFVVAQSAQGQIIGCGQIKPHRTGWHELASIAVSPNWRLRGVARAIIEHLLAVHPGDLYLTCRSDLGVFYVRFGFRVVEEANMPPDLRLLSRVFRWFSKLNRGKSSLLVMKRPQE